jgi:hypothetical protein
MSFGRYLLGTGELVLVVCAMGLGALRLRARWLPDWSGAPARLAEIVIAAAALVVVLEIAGVAQLLRPIPVLIAALGAGALMATLGETPRPAAAAPPPEQLGRWASAAALAAMLVVAAHWAVLANHAFSVGMYEGDENWYHLPYAARFMQDGSITSLHYASPSYLSWFHPLNSELFHALGMVAYHRDIASPFINLIWFAVALLAAWCVGRPFGVAPITAVAAAIALDVPVFAGTQAGTAMSDLFGLAFLLAAVALLLGGRTGRSGQISGGALLVAGIAGGLALAAKLSFALPVVVLLAGVIAFAPRGSRGRAALLTFVPTLVTGSFWYLRDFAYTLNPFPYVQSLGPIDLPGPDEGLNGGPPFSVSHYLTDGRVWSDWFLPGLRDQVGHVWFVLVALCLVGIVAGLWQRRDRIVLSFAAAALAAFVFYLLTPEAAEGPEGMPISFTAGLRVLEPALAMGLVLAAIGAARLGPRPRLAALAVGLILALAGTNRSADFWHTGGQLAGAVLIVAVLIAAPLAAVAAARRGPSGRLATAVGLAAALALAVGIGWPRTERYLDHRYRTDDVPPLFRQLNMVPLYRWGSGISDSRIATSGILQYGLYGTDLSNHVQYLGRVGSDHSFREITDCRTWREHLNDGDYDYVVAMPRFGGRRELQARWTRDPHAQVLWHSAPITVFRLTGNLDPARCGTLPPL